MAARRRLVGRALAAVAISATPAAAQESQESPSEVAATFFKAVADERWLDAARYVDVAALDRYRRERIAAERLEPQRPPRAITAEELLRHDPDMPRAVAEYQARRMMEASRERPSWVEHEYAGVPDVDALAALSAEAAAARWLQARDLRWGARRAIERERARGCRIPPEAERSVVTQPHKVVAAAVVDSNTAYVLYEDPLMRRAHPDVDAELYADGPHVMTLRYRGGRWRILPRHGLLHGMVGVGLTATNCPPASRPPR